LSRIRKDLPLFFAALAVFDTAAELVAAEDIWLITVEAEEVGDFFAGSGCPAKSPIHGTKMSRIKKMTKSDTVPFNAHTPPAFSEPFMHGCFFTFYRQAPKIMHNFFDEMRKVQ
jgi:hypothetical protein